MNSFFLSLRFARGLLTGLASRATICGGLALCAASLCGAAPAPDRPNIIFIRGDAIQELDDSVGQLLATLDRLKLTEKTLVIFTSDNGGVMDDGYEDVGKFDYHPNAPLSSAGESVPFITP